MKILINILFQYIYWVINYHFLEEGNKLLDLGLNFKLFSYKKTLNYFIVHFHAKTSQIHKESSNRELSLKKKIKVGTGSQNAQNNFI